MQKIICMIPARLGSQRVPKKNLRLLCGKPLIAYAIEAAKEAGIFNEIYVNSEADVFNEVALKCGVKFYKRPESLASNTTNNDEFLFDFINNVQGDILVQLLPTSPLITSEEIKGFVSELLKKEYDTLVSVENHQIACVYKGKPINFSLLESHKSSQNMIPVQSYVGVLMGWVYEVFLKNIERHGCAYHGGSGKVGYYVLKGFSTIDIDSEEDFIMAEVAMQCRNILRT